MKLNLSILAAVTCLAAARAFSQDEPPVSYAPDDAKKFRNSGYKVISQMTDWRSAKQKCEEMGGRLVCIHDAKLQAFIAKLAGGQRLWIGLTDQYVKGRWQWVDGTPLHFKAWGPMQPDAMHPDEDFVNLRPDGKWNDCLLIGPSERDRAIGFICEWPASISKRAKPKPAEQPK